MNTRGSKNYKEMRIWMESNVETKLEIEEQEVKPHIRAHWYKSGHQSTPNPCKIVICLKLFNTSINDP